MVLAIVFGGGGSRGAFQAGVWQQLAYAGVRPDFVIGSSVGALNGLATTRMSPNALVRLWCNETPTRIYPNWWGQPTFAALIQRVVAQPRQYVWPALAVVTDVRTRKSRVVYLQGAAAVQCHWLLASAAFPGVFKPQRLGGRRYIDGGVSNDLPIDLALDIGATTTIAIGAGGLGPKPQIRATFTVLLPQNVPAMFDFSRPSKAQLVSLGQAAGRKLINSRKFKAWQAAKG